jgi:hypothetical protein
MTNGRSIVSEDDEDGLKMRYKNHRYFIARTAVRQQSILFQRSLDSTFYNDENDFLDIKIFKSRKSRKRKYESTEEHHQRVVE